MMPAFTSSSLSVLLCTAAFGQAARFEVASVKPAVYNAPVGGGGERGAGGGCPTSLKVGRGRVDIRCATLAMLIGYAFRHPPDRVKGPYWMMLAAPRQRP